MAKTRTCRSALGLLLFVAGLGSAGATNQNRDISVQADGDSVIARDSSGMPLWSRRLSLQLPLQVDKSDEGLFRVNGEVTLNASGFIVPDGAKRDANQVSTTQTYTWDTAAPINGDISASYVPQVFDKNGNAWAVVDDVDAGAARVVEFVAKKGIWKELKKLPEYFASGRLDVDALGNVTIVGLSVSQANGYALNAVRYEPSTGWGAPIVIYSEPYSANAIVNYGVVGDKYGNAIVVAGDTTVGALSVVYSAATALWQPMKPLTMPSDFSGGNANSIAIARSPNGKYVNVAYLAVLKAAGDTDYHLAYYSHAFDASSLSFGQPELLPKTDALKGAGVPATDNGGDRVNMVVDNSGIEYVVWTSGTNLRAKKLLGTYASVKKKGVWKDPVQLSKTLYYFGTDFSSMAVDSSGRVAACVTAYASNDSPTTMQFVVFRFTPGETWTVDIVATWQGSLQTRSRITWFGSGQAVGTYLITSDVAGGYQALSSSVFDAGAWGSSFPVPPDKTTTFSQSLATGPNGVPLLLFNPSTSEFINTTVQSTFLRGGS